MEFPEKDSSRLHLQGLYNLSHFLCKYNRLLNDNVRRIMLHTLLSIALVVVGVPAAVYLLWFIHCTLDRVCVRHARRFCRRHGLAASRVRWHTEFERRPDGTRGVKTEFTLVQLDCFDSQKQRRLVLLRVWPLGVRKLVSDEIYPQSYDEQWPQTSG